MRGSAEGRGCEVQGAEEATPCWAMASAIGPVPPCASAGDPYLLAHHSQTLAPRAAGVARSAALACGGGGRCGANPVDGSGSETTCPRDHPDESGSETVVRDLCT